MKLKFIKNIVDCLYYIFAKHKGINIKTSHSICAEQVALGQALANGEREFDTIVAVSLTTDGAPRIVSPCGLCRYIFEKLNINMNVIVRDINNNNEVLKVNTFDLLPYPYKRNS
jgi:cytidine deaminase